MRAGKGRERREGLVQRELLCSGCGFAGLPHLDRTDQEEEGIDGIDGDIDGDIVDGMERERGHSTR
jgi:hypothetical protein